MPDLALGLVCGVILGAITVVLFLLSTGRTTPSCWRCGERKPMACHSCAKDFERAIEKKIHQLRRHGREVQS